MSIKMLLKSAGVAILAGFTFTGFATAQVPNCEITQLSSGSKATDLYLQAETELLANDNALAAISLIEQMMILDLNCLEEGIALGLSAQIKISLEDYTGAIEDLETSLNKGYIPADQLVPRLLTIASLYFQEQRLSEGLDYMNRWLEAGGQPTRDQKFNLAAVNYQLENNQEALKWAEEVFATDGPNASRQVYDFLILLYDRTGNKAKKAELLEQLLVRDPSDRKTWDAIAGEYFQAGDDRKAFEVQKAMYLGGILTTEDELIRVVNFYNSFNAPYQAAKILEKEINAGRIDRTFSNLELLANLYQVAREHEKAIPVIERAARENNSASMYERLGRSYADIQEWSKAEDALKTAIDNGGQLKNRGLAWVLIGQSRYERDDRSGAREAFRSASSRGGRGWLAFMRSEDETAKAFKVFEQQQVVTKLRNEKKGCDELKVLGDANLPEGCASVDERIAQSLTTLEELNARDASTFG